jgi:hypothetical protein
MSRLYRLATLAAMCLSLGPAAFAQSNPGIPAKAIGQRAQTGPVPSLFVLNAEGATLADGKLTLTGVSGNSIVFADRPVRSAGHIETKQFIETWRQGEDNFAIDPPNATVSVLDGSNVEDAVVTISAPVLDGDTLTFTATTLEGSLDGATGVVALFIDDRGGGGGGRGGFGGFDGRSFDHFDNFSHVADPHAAYYRSNDTYNRNVNVNVDAAGVGRYGYGGYRGYPVGAGAVGLATGAAIGAAAANRWEGGQPCGYPPYPPCY